VGGVHCASKLWIGEPGFCLLSKLENQALSKITEKAPSPVDFGAGCRQARPLFSPRRATATVGDGKLVRNEGGHPEDDLNWLLCV
jgi:hypothetical protein